MSKKQKKKLTSAQKKLKQENKKKYEYIFINGKQKRVKRHEQIQGMPVNDFIMNNADPIWLVQNEMWEELYLLESGYYEENEEFLLSKN